MHNMANELKGNFSLYNTSLEGILVSQVAMWRKSLVDRQRVCVYE